MPKPAAASPPKTIPRIPPIMVKTLAAVLIFVILLNLVLRY
jgi:hypothetical protein